MPLLMSLLLVLAGCDLPQDPDNTLERARGGVLRVGAVETPPWVLKSGGEIDGVEADLVRRWAEELEARIEWIAGSESVLISALERHELDLVIGGLTQASPWKQRVGLTNPYLETEIMIGVPEGAARQPESWAGERIGYLRDDPAMAAHIRELDAIPVALAELGTMPVVAPVWQLTAWEFVPVGEVLRRHKHVLAVPPGENALLVALQKFLADQDVYARTRLDSEAGQNVGGS